MSDAVDRRMMLRAIQLARRAEGLVEPNPMVGCVLARGERVIAEGYHRKFGGPHAEIHALRRAGRMAKGATAYVTLEPCCHVGKTGPCTQALIEARVARVVAAIADPNPLIAGKGFRKLRDAGVGVVTGVHDDLAADLAAPFLKWMTTKRPWIIAKWGQSLDGKLAARNGEAKWVTDEAMREHANRVRGRLDAVVAGIGTVLADDPLLTCRIGRPRRIATRVVLDSRLRTPLGSKLVRTAADVPVWIFCGSDAPGPAEHKLLSAGCRVTRVPRAATRLDIDEILKHLAAANLTNVLIEGGGRLLNSFFTENRVDEIHAYVAPLLLGGATAITPWPDGAAGLAAALRFTRRAELRRIGNGWVYRARRGNDPR